MGQLRISGGARRRPAWAGRVITVAGLGLVGAWSAGFADSGQAPAASAPQPVLPLPQPAAQPTGPTIRYSGQAGDSIYWALRSAGVPALAASDYLGALGSRIDIRVGIEPTDRFDLVVDDERLVYAAIDRQFGRDVQLVRWANGNGSDWVEPSGRGGTRAGSVRPVAGRLTSAFGTRVHPIFGFARFHRGVDYAAAWGTPVAATADGRVTETGWNGGYGRQVRIDHPGGLTTTYSHLSGIDVATGETVRAGDTIGRIGSSGLSTGPHLHFEVHRHGVPVDPLQAVNIFRAREVKRSPVAVRQRIDHILAAARPSA